MRHPVEGNLKYVSAINTPPGLWVAPSGTVDPGHPPIKEMWPASLLAIGSLIAGRPSRSQLNARSTPPCCCTAPARPDGPPEDHARRGEAGRVQLARAAGPRRRGGGAATKRSPSDRAKIIALFRGAQEALGRDDLAKARVLLRHCLEIDEVRELPPLTRPSTPRPHPNARPSALRPARSTRTPTSSTPPLGPTSIDPGGRALLARASATGGAHGRRGAGAAALRARMDASIPNWSDRSSGTNRSS